MGHAEQDSVATASDELFDRYTLPKIALTIILIASLAGTVLSLNPTGIGSIPAVVAKWAYLVSLGVLVGGFCWKHGFVRPADLDDGTESYCARMYERFDSIVLAATAVLALTGSVVLIRYWLALSDPVVPAALTALLAALIVGLGASLVRSTPVDEQFRGPLGLATLGVAAGVVVGTTVAEVSLRGGTVGVAATRTVHLFAFALWLGGAVWNIFVAVPTGQESPTVPVVRAAGQQLERFRWAVRLIFPTIVLTGLYQASMLVGWSPQAYLGSILGLVVLGKLGLIGVLFVIFKLCPMWRACSPIEGVCDLEELGDSEVSNND